MAEEFKVEVGVEINTSSLDALKSQINSIKTDPIKIKFDTSDINSQISKIKSQIQNLSSYKIDIYGNSIKNNSTKDVSDISTAYKKLLSIQKELGNKQSKLAILDVSKDIKQIESLNKQIQNLKDKYNELFLFSHKSFSSDQVDGLKKAFDDVSDKIDIVNSKINDSKQKTASGYLNKFGNDTGKINKIIEQFNNLKNKTSEVRDAMREFNSAVNNMRIAQKSGDVDKIVQSYKEYENAIKRVNTELKNASSMDSLSKTRSALSSQMDVWLNDNSAASSKFEGKIRSLQNELKSCDSIRLNGIKSEFVEIANQAKLAGVATQSFGDRFKDQLSKLSTYFSADMLISGSMNTLREMYQNVIKIDSAFTELKKVTDESNSSYEKYMSNAAANAKEIGTTIDNYISSTADFARLGNTFTDSQELAKVANIYNVVGDDIANVGEATESIISTMTAFKVEAGDAIDIVDKFNEVSNKFAISSGGIGESVKRSASSMAVAGNTLDETIAMVTAANTVVQDEAKVGNAYKTLSMRIRGAETELKEAGLDTEGMAESTAKLREEIKALSGVDIMIDDDTFKSTYKIMDELSIKWKDLTDIQQASIIELIAGKQQGNVMASLMENFDIARKALDTSLNSEGSAMKEHDKWMESIEAKLQKLQATFQSLSQTIMNSDFLKGIIDGFTEFVNIVDTVINKIGVLPTLVGAITAGFSFSGKGIFKVVEDEYKASGVRIQNNLTDAFKKAFDSDTFSGAFKNMFNFINSDNEFSFGDKFSLNLESDIESLTAYADAIKNNVEPTSAFENIMSTASDAAKDYAESVDKTKISVEDFANKQKSLQVSLKTNSFKGISSLINEYNSGLKNCGLTQSQFLSSVSSSNASLGKYLSGLNGAKGSMTGYVGSLIKGKAATIGMHAASLALSTALSMGVTFAITAVVSAIANWINKEKEAREATIETGNAAREEAKNLTDLYEAYKSANSAYKNGTGSKENLTSATNSLREALGIEASEVSNLAQEYRNLDDAYKAVMKSKLQEKIDESRSGIHAEQKEFTDKNSSSFSKGIFIESAFSKNKDAEKQMNKLLTSKNLLQYDGLLTTYQGNDFDKIIENYERLKSVRQELIDGVKSGKIDLSLDELYDTSFYSNIDKEIQKLEGADDIIKKISEHNEMVSTLQIQDYMDTNGVPKSINDYKNLEQAVREAALANDDFVGSEHTVNDSITNAIAAFPELTTFFEEQANAVEESSKATEKQLSKLKEEFKDNDVSKWFDSLSDEDKQLVYTISVDSDESKLWNLTKWQQELTDMQLAGKSSEEALQSFYETMADTGDGNFLDNIDTYTNRLQTLQDALDQVDAGTLSDADMIDLVKNFPELTGKTGDVEELKEAISELIGETEKGLNEYFEQQIESVGGASTTAGQKLLEFKKMIESLNDSFDFDIDAEIEKFNKLFSVKSESVSSTGLSTDGINSVKSMFSGLNGYDPSALFERTEHGIHLNTTALRALQSQYESVNKLDIQKQLQSLKQNYNDTKIELEGLTKGTAEYNQKMSDLSGIEDEIQNVQTLAAQYEGLTSAYNKWILAQSSGEEGDMYDNITGSLENIKELYDKGLTGTNAFRSAVQMMTDEDLSTANIDKIISTYEAGFPTMQRYFTETQDGCVQFLEDIQAINSKWAHIDENGNWDINFGIGNDEEIAKAISDMMGLQISTEQVQLIMRKLSDYSFDINLDSAYTSVEELQSRVEETESKLKEMGQEPVDIDINVDAKNIDAEIDNAKSKIQELETNESIVDVDVQTAKLDDANAKLDTLIRKKIEASQPTFMEIDVTTDLADAEEKLQNAVSLLQEYQTAVNELSVLEIKGADDGSIDTAKAKVDELAGKIQSLDKETKIQIGIDETDNIETIQSKIKDNKVAIDIDADTSKAEEKVKELEDKEIGVGLNIEGEDKLNNIKSIIEELENKIINITAEVHGTEKLEELKYALEELKEKSVNATAIASGKEDVDALKKSIDALHDKTVKATAKVSGTNLVNALKKAIDKLISKTVKITAKVIGASAVNSLKRSIDNLKDKTVTVNNVVNNIKNNISSKNKKGDGEVDGTAHSQGTTNIQNNTYNTYNSGKAHEKGTAFARGNWGTKDSGIALGGELGTELIVRNGRFFTIGDESAEFFKYQKGDIIFNAEQTKEIFEKGKITHGKKRGKALYEGTAFSNGYGGFNGGIGSSGRGSGSSSNPGSNNNNNNSASDIEKAADAAEDAAEQFKETIDWIEKAIDRIERSISNLDLTVSSTYRSWSKRNNALVGEISEISQEIAIQQSGYERYLQQANSVGLDPVWAEMIKNGAIDISTIEDEELANKIQEFEEWYVKALDCRDAINQLNENISELYKTSFDHVVSQYDGILNVVRHEKSMLDEFVTQTEEKGYITSTKYYEALMKNQRKDIAEMEKEKTALLVELNDSVASGAIDMNSEAWYEMINQIDEVTLAIEEGNTALIEYANSIRDIEWEVFDLLQSRISNVSKEADYFIKLLSNKKLYDDRGQLTDEGMSTMGLHGMNYNVYMNQADEYAEEIRKLNAEIEKDPYDQNLINRRNELLELQQEMILAAENEKDAIIDMVEEGIELELNALKELIDTYTDALDAQKDLYDYQKKVKEQTDEIASLEKQKKAYENDNSEESRLKKQQIDVSLEKAKQNLEETEYERYISDQKKLLDSLYLEYETILNERLDNVDALISDMIFEINNSADIINSTLQQSASNVGYTITDELKTIWQNASNQMTSDTNRRVEEVSKVVSQLVANGSLSREDANNIINALGNGDLQGITNATNIINQLVSQGTISQQDSQNLQNTVRSTGIEYKGVITNYGEDFRNKHTTTNTVLENIKINIAAMMNKLDQQAAQKVQQAATSSSINSSSASGNGNGSKKPVTTTPVSRPVTTTAPSKPVRTDTDYYGIALAICNGTHDWGVGQERINKLTQKGFDANKVQSIVNKLCAEGLVYSGAWVGKYNGIKDLSPYNYSRFKIGAKNIKRDQDAWVSENGNAEAIVRPSDGAILVPLANGDSVLNSKATDNIWNMSNDPSGFIRDNLKLNDIGTPNISNSQNSYIQNLDKIVFNMPNVKNYDDLLSAMQHDKNFERLIHSMTIDVLSGKSSLSKYNSIHR